MNIPDNILQAIADAAFAQSSSSPLSCVLNGTNWKRQPNIRRAVIQHALSNPALAPFLAGGIGVGVGEYTDGEILESWRNTNLNHPQLASFGPKWIKAFLAALPRRESPAFAEATPTAEPEPAAQVPLGTEDVPPGSVVRCDTDHWFQVLYASPIGVCVNNVGLPVQYRWIELAERWQINSSIPDTGRWDANAWRPCSKTGK